MTAAALLADLSFAAVLAALSAAIVWMMVGVGVLDRPDPRKAHTGSVPKGGGVGVVAAFLCGIVLLSLRGGFARSAEPYLLGVVLAGAGIAVVAYLDDVRDWPFTIKLAAQVAAAATAILAGLAVSRIDLPGVGTIPLAPFGAVATLVWIVFTTNAVNFIDGLNGLAAGVSAIACAALAGIAAAAGATFVHAAALLLLAGLIGFLPFNFPRARIFMGDVGSQFCGFVLAVLGVASSQFGVPIVVVPLLLSGVLFDVAFTLVRRLRARDRLTEAHRSHLYQLAHRAGMSATRVTLLHWAFALWGAVVCAIVLANPSGFGSAAMLLIVPPQLVWTLYVLRRARLAAIGRW